MRVTMCVIVLLLAVPLSSAAQEPPVPSSKQSSSLVGAALQEAASLGRRPPVHGARYCCNLKGAIIGASVGAGLGLMLSPICDAGALGCMVQTTAGLAAIGGALGAFASHHAPSFPAVGIPASGVRAVGASVTF
jgi:hypothetical protein